MIEYNCLDLIPDKKFHSCILTGYNCDLYFFDQIILPKLRQLGIMNILVLIDSNILSHNLGRVGGNSSIFNKPVSIHGIRCNGSFHPKLNLFFGESDGFLIIGSGNPTSGGFGNNHEIWGAFHIADTEDEKTVLFKSVFDYILKFKSQLKGHVLKKIDWINEYSPWLKELKDSENSGISLSEKLTALFLDTQKLPLIQFIRDYFSNIEVDEIHILAPFFDQELSVIQDLNSIFPKSQINIYLQSDRVLFPKKIPQNISSKIQFYDWNCDDSPYKNRYLHAKCIIFKNEDNEFCLIGSANPTRAAFGTLKTRPVNEEACLLLKRTEGSWLDELSLSSITNQKSFSMINQRFQDSDLDDFRSVSKNWKIYIFSAYRDFKNLIIYTQLHEEVENLSVIFFDSWGEKVGELLLDKSNLVSSNEALTMPINDNNVTDIDRVNFVQILDSSANNSISNKVLIHNVNQIYKSDPDPVKRKLEIFLSEVEAGNEHFLGIFHYLNHDEYLDEGTGKVNKTPGFKYENTAGITESNISSSQNNLSYEEFIQAPEYVSHHTMYRRLSKYSSIWQVLEVLTLFFKKGIEQKKEQENLEEQQDVVEISAGRDDSFELKDQIDNIKLEVREFDIIQKKMLLCFRKYLRKLDDQIEKKHKPNYVDLIYLVMILELLLYSVDLKLKIKSKTKKENERNEKILLPFAGNPVKQNSFVDFVVQAIGKFNLLTVNGMEIPQTHEMQRFSEIKNILFHHIIFCLSVLDIYASEKGIQYTDEKIKLDNYSNLSDWIWTLYSNVFQIFDRVLFSQEFNENLLIERLNISPLREKYVLSQLVSSYDKYTSNYDQYNKTDHELLTDIESSQRVFSELLNIFCVVRREQIHEKGIGVLISHTGYNFDKIQKDYLRKRPLVIPYAKFKIV